MDGLRQIFGFGFFAVLLAAVFPASLKADPLVGFIDGRRRARRDVRGNFYLARVQSLKKVSQDQRNGTVRLIENLESPDEDPTTVDLVVMSEGILPLDQDLVMCLFLEGDRAWLNPIETGDRTMLYLDRGPRNGRLLEATRNVLFDSRRRQNPEAFFDELLRMTAGRDKDVAELAAHYLGSTLSPFARPDVDPRLVNGLTDALLQSTRAEIRHRLAGFYAVARLPQDRDRLHRLLSCNEAPIIDPVVYRLKRSAAEAPQLKTELAALLTRPSEGDTRMLVLRSLEAWGPVASDFWPAVSRLATGHPSTRPTDPERLAATELLLRINPERAERPVRRVLGQMDTRAIYRFVYRRRMVDCIDILVDKLRRKQTRHPEVVCALLGSLSGAVPDDYSAQAWVPWYDHTTDGGRHAPRTGAGDRPASKARLAGLVEQLGSASWQHRRDASRRLMALGEAAEAALREATDHDDFEIAEAAKHLLSASRQRRARHQEVLFGKAPESSRAGSN